MNPKKLTHIFAQATILALIAVSATTALAQTDTTWIGASAGNWTVSANWSGGVAPGAGFNAIFSTNGSSGPSQITTLAIDKITFATGGASFSPSFQGWNVNTAGTFIEVQSGNTQNQNVYNTRGNGSTILLQSGTSTILNNGSGPSGLFVGSNVNVPNAKLMGASGGNSTLVVDGSGTTTIGTSGSGTTMPIADGNSTAGAILSLTKRGSGSLTLNSANTFSGGLTLEGNGTLNLAHSNAAGNGTIFLKSTQTGALTTVGLSGGITVANAIQIDSSTGREFIASTGTGDTSLTGGITISTSNSTTIVLANNQSSGNLTVSGGISGPTYTGSISLRGTQPGNKSFLNGVVTLSSATSFVDVNASGNWTLNTAGSRWNQTVVHGAGGFILGVADALPTTSFISFSTNTSTGSIDLNGYNQSVTGLNSVAPATGGNGGRITNGGNVDSILTIAGMTGDRTYNGTITNGDTNKISVVMNSTGRTQTLAGNNTYTGNTTVNNGTLVLANNGQLLFDIDADGVNNQINGNGTLTLNGTFKFDLTGAAGVGSWTIVTGSLTKTFGGNFSVFDFTETGINTWTKVSGTSTYTFSESSGVLTAAVPEPSTWVLLALSLLFVVTLRRRRLM